jgi:hypothetical protein
MATLDALIASYKAANQPTYNATQQDYATQLANLTGSFNTALAQQKQALGAIPGTYQPARESAYLANQKANLAAPAVAANQGYASGAGADYDFRQANNADWQKSVDTTNQAQNTAVQTANNGIANTQNTYNTNAGTLNANEAKDLAALDAQTQAQANTQYNTDQALAEQQREFDQQQAAAVAQTQQSYNNSQQAAAVKAATPPTQAQINSMTKGQGPVAAINNIVSAYGAGTQAADNALASVGYTGISFDANNQPHILNTLSDYATYGLNSGKMYDKNGFGHTISTIAEYNGALANKWSATSPYSVQMSRGRAQ